MPVDLDQIKQQLENMSGLPFNIIRLKYGPNKDHPFENKLKLLSWPPTGGQLAKKVYKHFGLGPDGYQQAICPKTFGNNEDCPVCNWVDASSRSDDPTLAERIKKLTKGERYMQLCIDWNAFEEEKDPAKKMRVGIYDCPPKVHRMIMQTMASQDYDFTLWESALVSVMGYENGPGLPKGVDFKVAMKQMKPEIVELNPEDWLPLVPDLDDAVKSPAPAQLAFLLEGKEPSSPKQSAEFPNVEAQPKNPPAAETPKEKPQTAPAPKVEAEAPKSETKKKSLTDIINEAKAAAAKKKEGQPY